MSDDTKVKWGRFCWHDNVSDDPAKAIEFYTGLLGWELEDFDMGPAGTYKMWKASDGTTMGGFVDKPMPEAPSFWLGFVQVEDADETLARVTNNGGIALSPIIEIPGIGRAVTCKDPQGGVFGAYQPLGDGFETAADWVPPRLAVCWNELISADVAASTAFYAEVFGWKGTVQEMAPGFQYTIFTTAEGMQVAGLMQAPPPHTGMTAWLAHVSIDDLAATLEKAKSLGGKVHTEPQTIPNIGSFALVADTNGAFFYAFEPSAGKCPE
jgi:predicted enzyme related to lactoylglutathione lyase